MKQKLLFSLLALLVSVGVVKAQFTVTPVADQTVTVTKSGGDAWVKETVEAIAGVTFSNANSIQIKNSTASAVTVSLGGSYTSLTFSGKATAIGVTTTSVETISVTNNGELASFSGLPAGLKSLSCSGNKLEVLPKKSDFASMTTYTVGTQTPKDGTITGIEGDTNPQPANKPLDLTIAKITGLSAVAANVATGTYTYESWTLKATSGTYSSTSYPTTDASAPFRYYFMTGSMTSPGTYMDGDYKFTLAFASTHPDYPNAKIAGIPVKILPAVFTLGATTIVPDVNPIAGGVVIYRGSEELTEGTSLVYKGDELTYIPQAGQGYSFSSFNPAGMTLIQSSVTTGSDTRKYTVSGTVAPSMTATFKGEDNTITYTDAHTGGTLKVYNNTTNALITTGTNIASGTTIRIVATPADGYKVNYLSDLKLNATAITGVAGATAAMNGKELEATYTVQGVPIVLNIQFTASSERALTLRFLVGSLNTQSVNGATADVSEEENGYYIRTYNNVELSTQPTIRLVTNPTYSITGITANGAAVSYTHTSTDGSGNKTYVVTGFTMPNTDVLMAINTAELSTPKITIAEAQKLVYNGSGQNIGYTTDPVGLTNVKVEYKVTSALDNTYSTNLFVDANTSGSYTARITRPTDAVYGEPALLKANGSAWDANTIPFTIVAAKPTVATVPTVTISKNTTSGEYEYKISGGSVTYKNASGSNVTVPGSSNLWQVVKVGGTVDLNTSHGVDDGNIAVPGSPTEPETHLVSVRFTAMTSSTNPNTNFEQVAVVAEAKYGSTSLTTVQVQVLASAMPTGTSLTMLNGEQSLGTSATVKVGTRITFVPVVDAVTYPSYTVKQVDAMGVPVSGAEDLMNTTPKGILVSGTKMYFAIVATAANDLRTEATIKTAIDNTKSYTGSAIYFDPTAIVLQDKQGNTIDKDDSGFPATGWTFTYKNASGTTVVSPVQAGSYTVTMSRPADANEVGKFKAISGTGTLVIKKATPSVVSWPEVAYVATGQKLSTALFDGGQPAISGSFAFVDGTITPSTGVAYAIKFVPDDAVNYEELIAPDAKKVIPTEGSKRVLVITTPVNGTITVVGSNGVTYTSGIEIPSTVTYLKVTATPATGYTLTSLLVNDTEFTSGNNYTLSSTANGPISVKAVFSNATSYPVDLIVGRGVQVVSKSGTSVAAGKNFTFTLATAAGDVPRVEDEDGTTIVAEDGVYTLENVLKAKTVNITLDSPTEITVTVTQTPTGNGVIHVENLSKLRADSYYYGDTLRLTMALKEDYELIEWWDGNKEVERLYVVTKDVEISGTVRYNPVGIEPIENLEVRGGEGYIYVGAPGEVAVTIVSMSGRTQKVRVNGEEYIRELPAGIYGVVVEQGNKASKVKVAVK